MTLLAVGLAAAEVQRFAVVVGNNEGFAGSRPLYFAELDAKKVQSVLTTLGDVEAHDVELLLGKGRNDLLTTLALVRGPIAEAKGRGDQTVLYFYYSGHADDTQLQLGRTFLTWAELETLLERSGADVRVAFVDACQSGTITRLKGGTLAPGFVTDVSERLDSKGTVVITSSAGDEASQESNEIGGSYFTHFLASGLTGAADQNGDDRVTLAETYQHVYRETVYRTSQTRSGTQHPMMQTELESNGELVLTELARAGATLSFPGDNPGAFTVFDVERKMFVAEVDVAGADRRVALRPGRYQVQRRFPTYLAVADVLVPASGTVTVAPEAFRALEYEDDVAKGTIDKVIRKAELPRTSVRMLLGGRGFAGDPAKTQYFPNTPAAGAEARIWWRDGRYATLDLLGGSGAGELAISGLPYEVPVQVGSATLGAGYGYATPERAFRFGGGFHLESIFLSRTFPGQNVSGQRVFSVAPGLAAWGGWYPYRFELELALRTHYLPYVPDDRDAGFLYNELFLAMGYRF
ncbi:MAG: caspase family protein [Myxococcota bacterium]